MFKPLATLALLLALSASAAQGLPDPFLGDVPPPPPPADGDPSVQNEFLPPPGVQGDALRPYPLYPMMITLPSDAPLVDYDPIPGLNLELTVAAPRPDLTPAAIVVENNERGPQPTQPTEEELRARRLDQLLASIPSRQLPDPQPLATPAVAPAARVPDFTLLALVTGARPVAVLDIDGRTHRLYLGDAIPSSHYIVEEIHPQTLVVAGAGNTITIPLE